LVCYGHDLYNPNREKHQYADTPEKIAMIDIELKFRFLEKHGFAPIVQRNYQFIRNRIAHNDFKCIDDSSTVTLSTNKGNGKVIEEAYDLKKELVTLLDFSINLIRELEKLLNTSLNCKSH
jgi:hypothetical protein